MFLCSVFVFVFVFCCCFFFQFLFNPCTCMLEVNFHNTFPGITVTAIHVINLYTFSSVLYGMKFLHFDNREIIR